MNTQELFDGFLTIFPRADLTLVTLDLPSGAGVCLLTDADDRPVLLLFGANLRALVRRRLAEKDTDEKTRRAKVRPLVRRVWFRRCFSPFETQLTYFRIARAAYPDSYQEFFPHLEVWFVHINPADKYPFFTRTKQIKPHGGIYWGPFAEPKSAAHWVETLQNGFDLCRRPAVLTRAPHATACTYAQMSRCAAVCDGTVSREQYRKIIEQAIDFLNLSPKAALDAMRRQMRRHSEALQFEQAQHLRKKIDTLQMLRTPAYRWIAPLESFLVLAFQPGPALKLPDHRAKQPSVSPFLIGPGWVDQIEPFPPSYSAAGCEALRDHINLALLQERFRDLTLQQQHLFAWTTHLLYRKNPRDRGLYLPVDENLTTEKLTRELTNHFSRPFQSNQAKPQLDAINLSAPSQKEKPDP